MDPVLEWLLDGADPAVRARALVDPLDRPEDDPDVAAARQDAAARGSAARVLDGLAVASGAAALYRPKYVAPFHRLIALAEMGAPASYPVAGVVLDRCLDAFMGPGEGSLDAGDWETCLTGNLARAALLMGRGHDSRVALAIDWLVREQLPDGGWHCWPREVPHGTLDAWEALDAFAAIPRGERSPAVREAIARGVAFVVERNLGLDDAYDPWRRLHAPRHHYYDVLVGLDLATALGSARDPRLRPALAWLVERRGTDGRWRIDADHPDLDDGAEYAPESPGLPVTPLRVEAPGEPSRWVTLVARRVLRRAGLA